MAFSISLNQLKAAVDEAMAQCGIIGVATIRVDTFDLFVDISWTGKTAKHECSINLESVQNSKYDFYLAFLNTLLTEVNAVGDQ